MESALSVCLEKVSPPRPGQIEKPDVHGARSWVGALGAFECLGKVPPGHWLELLMEEFTAASGVKVKPSANCTGQPRAPFRQDSARACRVPSRAHHMLQEECSSLKELCVSRCCLKDEGSYGRMCCLARGPRRQGPRGGEEPGPRGPNKKKEDVRLA
ncbi:hypothetical protein NDU88_007484 [Pleurodeles waltl]|uniref:Uncharacterized protein n=1 Tax=Pleurodeles waltl TaxID=8319 RepID=A0AAV7NY37_PLEWA|nr:hypothetical protein NDU88_007484 [Pleurodeles waltl]